MPSNVPEETPSNESIHRIIQRKIETEEKCSNCKYWKASKEEEKVGFCRRYPPVNIDEESFYYGKGIWLLTENDKWCGEFKRNQV